jgi:hypothetical protein
MRRLSIVEEKEFEESVLVPQQNKSVQMNDVLNDLEDGYGRSHSFDIAAM